MELQSMRCCSNAARQAGIHRGLGHEVAGNFGARERQLGDDLLLLVQIENAVLLVEVKQDHFHSGANPKVEINAE